MFRLLSFAVVVVLSFGVVSKEDIVVAAFTSTASSSMHSKVLNNNNNDKQICTRGSSSKNNVCFSSNVSIFKEQQLQTKTMTQLNAASSLVAAPVTAIKTLSPTTRIAVAVGAFVVMIMTKYSQRILFPGVIPDTNFNEPLPPGKIDGCPFVGNLAAFSNMNAYFYRKAKIADPNTTQPKIWKNFFFFKPTAVLAGSKIINQVLGREFTSAKKVTAVEAPGTTTDSSAKASQGGGGGAISQVTDFGNTDELFGAKSLSFETQSSKRYHAIRNLVGQAMTPKAVADSVPALQAAAETAVSKFTEEEISVEPVCRELTLDVSWRQIIGLNLETPKEINEFYDDVNAWMKGIVNFLVAYYPKFIQRHLKCVKAKKSLTQKIDSKIDELLKQGQSDGTTMGNMVYATTEEDEDDTKRIKLTREEVIDNVFLLIVAGSETSANTLTCALLLLGMYPDVYQKLVKEQENLVETYGTTLTKELLDETKAPYLDAVLKETMRLMPISGGGIRQVQETLVVNGKQIPKNWYVLYAVGLTHKQDPITQKLDGIDNNMDITKGYKPERWLSNDTKPTTEFIPWGAGHRFCLGHTLATAEMKIFLATLARQVESFELKTDPLKAKWKEGIIRTPSDGVTIVPHLKKGLNDINNISSNGAAMPSVKTVEQEKTTNVA